MYSSVRLFPALRASGIHLLGSMVVAALAALLVFTVWYPHPFGDLSGGKELFFLVVTVDVICGPLLTMVLFNTVKPRAELTRDIGLVVLIQLLALMYGLWTVWQARPLFLVQEIDRFKVIAAPDLDREALAALPTQLKPTLFSGPIVMALREPKDVEERNKVTLESIVGGRDYAERPEFYIAYDDTAALKSLKRVKSLSNFLQKYPDQQAQALSLAKKNGVDLDRLSYLPIIARQDWIALLDNQGHIKGFLKGDGF